MRPQVKFIFQGTHMILGHNGLGELIKEERKKNALFRRVYDQGPCLILFINKARTRAKLFSPSADVIGYLRVPASSRLLRKTLDLIPNTFGGSIEYARSVVKALDAMFIAEEKRAA